MRAAPPCPHSERLKHSINRLTHSPPLRPHRLGAQPAQPMVTMLYLLHAPSVAAPDGLVLGALSLPAAELRAISARLMATLRVQTEPTTVPAAAKASLPSAREALEDVASALAALVYAARGIAAPPVRAAPAEGGGAVALHPDLGAGALQQLASLFGSQLGGVAVDEGTCKWLHTVLVGKPNDAAGAPLVEE